MLTKLYAKLIALWDPVLTIGPVRVAMLWINSGYRCAPSDCLADCTRVRATDSRFPPQIHNNIRIMNNILIYLLRIRNIKL